MQRKSTGTAANSPIAGQPTKFAPEELILGGLLSNKEKSIWSLTPSEAELQPSDRGDRDDRVTYISSEPLNAEPPGADITASPLGRFKSAIFATALVTAGAAAAGLALLSAALLLEQGVRAARGPSGASHSY